MKATARKALQRPLIEAMIEDDFFPVTGVSDEWDRMSASFDGVLWVMMLSLSISYSVKS